MRDLLTDVFKTQGTWIRVFVGKETIQDPYEKDVTVVHTNSIPIRAIVEDLTTTQALWKMPGIKVSKVKDIFVEVKHRNLITKSTKIQIDGECYEGWKENGKLQFREQPGIGHGTGYLRLYVYSKVT